LIVQFDELLSLNHLSALLTLPKFPAHRCKLDNGLTVLHQRIPAAPVVVVDVWVRAGAIAEPRPWSGMAHFLEHMIFKGTDRLAPGAFDQIIESQGGVTNAATSHDYAHYFIHTTPANLGTMLPVLAELLLNAAIPDDEFERERLVVLEEIRQANDDPDCLAFQSLMESVYQRHAYGRPVLGDAETLMARSPQEMRQFHQAHYQPDKMTVVIVGDVEQQVALELADQAFSQFAHQLDCPCPELEAEPPITEIRRQELHLPRLEQARLLLAWIGPGVEQLRHAYGLDLLSILLAGGRTSRLVRELREEQQWVQAINSGFSLQRDSSLFTISAWLEPEHLPSVETHILDRLHELTTTPIPAEELNRHKRLLCSDYAFSTETASQVAGLYGYYNTIAQAELAVTYPEVVQSFQPEEIQQLASQYLSPHHYAVTVAKPTYG
jgi:zinc protease